MLLLVLINLINQLLFILFSIYVSAVFISLFGNDFIFWFLMF